MMPSCGLLRQFSCSNWIEFSVISSRVELLKNIVNHKTDQTREKTNLYEGCIALSKILTRFLAFGARKGFLRPVLNYGRKIMEEYYTNEAIHRVVAEKIAPLNLSISEAEPLRFNIFIPDW